MKASFRAAILATLVLAGTMMPAAAQQVFPTGEAAADALVRAVESRDEAALQQVLGRRWRRYVPTHDIAPEDVDAFLAAARTSLRVQPAGEGWAVIQVGAQSWPFPIPLRARRGGWQYDLKQGEEEIRTRRVGRNELATIQAVLAYVDAQFEYSQEDRNGDGLLEYARRLISSPGTKDGLYWPPRPGEPESPLGPLFGGDRPGAEYHGYRFRILTAQGAHARGGERSLLIGGRLTAGFALIAWPATYDDSGVKTFLVSHDGVVFEKDLGRRTASIVRRLTAFDPDDTWTRVDQR